MEQIFFVYLHMVVMLLTSLVIHALKIHTNPLFQALLANQGQQILSLTVIILIFFVCLDTNV